eukprot:CAMPEP_0115194030 /NCGR_PEP_ID=MMETSP0270-20121206/13864_1 /TAXON_ID=71861 /ORGANISM="Scrippsiella trochoidea, Strain CCMP3099" /LENGTH=103 /DNA_ID=CAMNT_0002607327 /DNA_START=363 /DNA_END=670 /DNA_ORIENTATION=+
MLAAQPVTQRRVRGSTADGDVQRRSPQRLGRVVRSSPRWRGLGNTTTCLLKALLSSPEQSQPVTQQRFAECVAALLTNGQRRSPQRLGRVVRSSPRWCGLEKT